jgi:hypothetical protein
MWKIMLLAAAAALIIVGSLAIAEQPFMVKCCVKGSCRTMTRPECNRVGYIVANCGQCR